MKEEKENYIRNLLNTWRLKQYGTTEGSIAEGYLSEEILTFCSRYLDNTETRINRPWRVDDEPVDVLHNSEESMFPTIEKALGAVSHFELTPIEKHQAHHHVLVNCDAVVLMEILPEYSGEIVPDSLDGEESDSKDNLDEISSVAVDRSMQIDLNKVPDEEDETLEDQQDKQDDIHVKQKCFDLNKMPWYGDEISDPLKREAHRFITEYFLPGQYDVGEKF
ncbi:hypothetical protein Ahy_B10g101369 [Arachis hypogaea]|uniref:DUF4218 domain-containing protein n=1 Tax=Arachis hypogaea TaxID=3818 RepID=A0A444WZE7_ARAHY|nr:hypothetical protein Ahy_B10g101369 [Arachis hypogaea]